MKSQLLYLAGAVALLLWLVSLGLLTQHIDARPDNWGPRGVEFEEWIRAWESRRDLYVWVGACSFLSGVASGLAGLRVSYGRRLQRTRIQHVFYHQRFVRAADARRWALRNTRRNNSIRCACITVATTKSHGDINDHV